MQNYQNHKRIYALHMHIFIPITLVLFVFSIYKSIQNWNENFEMGLLWLVVGIGLFLLLLFSGMTRLHYGMILQNRLIVNEVYFRYYQMTGKEMEKEVKLSDEQLFAIRFASDEEFLPLIEKIQKENLSPDEIKRSIKKWKADYRRI